MKRIIPLLMLLAVFLIPNGNQWIMRQGDAAQSLLYHFFHANIFHLFANALSLYVLIPHSKMWHFSVSYVIASLYAAIVPYPMIGFSNVIYALIGVRTPSFNSYWWKHPGTLIFFSVTILMLLLPSVSGVSHIVTFVVGMLVSIIVRRFKQISHDSARYI